MRIRIFLFLFRIIFRSFNNIDDEAEIDKGECFVVGYLLHEIENRRCVSTSMDPAYAIYRTKEDGNRHTGTHLNTNWSHL